MYLPERKELHFFDGAYEKGLDWYFSQFSGYAGQKAVGEITPLYLHTAPLERIKNDLPRAQLIVILREPVDRAYSSYKLLRDDLFGDLSFTEAMNSGRGKALLGYSLYAEKLERLFDLFPREQVLIETYDKVIQEAAQLYGRVCEHIGVDSSFVPSRLSTISNRIILPTLQARMRRLGLGAVIEAVKSTPLGNGIKKISKHRQKRVDASSEIVNFRRSQGKHFESDILRCQELTGLDLSAWINRV